MASTYAPYSIYAPGSTKKEIAPYTPPATSYTPSTTQYTDTYSSMLAAINAAQKAGQPNPYAEQTAATQNYLNNYFYPTMTPTTSGGVTSYTPNYTTYVPPATTGGVGGAWRTKDPSTWTAEDFAQWMNDTGATSDFPPRDQWPEGYHPEPNNIGGYSYVPDSPGMTEADKLALEFQIRQFEELSAWQKAQLAQGNAGNNPQWRPGELELEQQQLAQQQQYYQWQEDQANKEYMSQLAANPKSWLEYAAYTGQQPVVQPWMLPLMSQDYGFNAGGAIPGWTAEDMSNIPSLLNPSAQYLARMGPTAQQQYYGYQQAQQGATPAETQWRLWSMAPPGGQATQLSYAQEGGVIPEPTLLYGLQSRKPYGIAGETAPEYIVPQNQANRTAGVPPTYETPWGTKGTGFIPNNWRQNPITIPSGNQPTVTPNFPVKPNLMSQGNIPNQSQMIPPWARQPNRLSYAVR
jgi:hypothetical protein